MVLRGEILLLPALKETEKFQKEGRIMYPRLRDNVELGTYTLEDSTEENYYATNPDKVDFEISKNVYEALLHADGTAPLRLRCRNKKAIEKELKKAKLITTSRLVLQGVFNCLILVAVGRRAKRIKKWSALCNGILPILSVLLFAAGLIALVAVPGDAPFEFHIGLYFLAFFLSLTLHELGHFNAAVAYGHEVYHAGILLLGILPIGAYVAFAEKKESRGRRLQIALAGIEMNLLCAGLALLVRCAVPSLFHTFTAIALVNCILAGVNLLPCEGLDGEMALSALLRVQSVSDCAKAIVFHKERRRKLLRRGLGGYVCMGVLLSTYLAKAVVAVLLIRDFITIVGWF